MSNKKKLVRAAADRDEIEKRDLSRRKKEIGEREYEETQAKKALAKSVRSWGKESQCVPSNHKPVRSTTERHDDNCYTRESEKRRHRCFATTAEIADSTQTIV